VAQRVVRGIAVLFHDRGTRRGRVVNSTPRPRFTPRKDLVPILQRTGWAPGPVWMGVKSRPHRDWIPDRPARSQSLYQLRYTEYKRVPSRNHMDGFGQDILSRSKFSDNYIPASVNLHKCGLPRSAFMFLMRLTFNRDYFPNNMNWLA